MNQHAYIRPPTDLSDGIDRKQANLENCVDDYKEKNNLMYPKAYNPIDAQVKDLNKAQIKMLHLSPILAKLTYSEDDEDL